VGERLANHISRPINPDKLPTGKVFRQFEEDLARTGANIECATGLLNRRFTFADQPECMGHESVI